MMLLLLLRFSSPARPEREVRERPSPLGAFGGFGDVAAWRAVPLPNTPMTNLDCVKKRKLWSLVDVRNLKIGL